jgi:hypothetical protein
MLGRDHRRYFWDLFSYAYTGLVAISTLRSRFFYVERCVPPRSVNLLLDGHKSVFSSEFIALR